MHLEEPGAAASGFFLKSYCWVLAARIAKLSAKLSDRFAGHTHQCPYDRGIAKERAATAHDALIAIHHGFQLLTRNLPTSRSSLDLNLRPLTPRK